MPGLITPPGLFGPVSISRSRRVMTRDSFVDTYMPAGLTLDSATATGLAFLQGELEKLDPTMHEPMTNVTWQEDIVARTGGGWNLYSSAFFNDFGSPNNAAPAGTQSNVIPMVEANLSKDIWPLFAWKRQFQVDYVDQALLQQIGRSLESLLNDAVRLAWNKWLDMLVHTGLPDEGITGLINSTVVTSSTAAAGASGLTTWAGKVPNEILADIDTVLMNTVVASEYDRTGMADTIMIPWNQWTQIRAPMTVAGATSIYEYVMKNNVANDYIGRQLTIVPRRWCAGAGVGPSDRMFAYVNREERVRFDMTVPLARIQSYPFAGKYVSIFAGQAGQVQWLYPQTAYALDGI